MSTVTFGFSFHQFDKVAFDVVAFNGTETMSECYRYELDLVCYDINADASDVLYQICQIQINDASGDNRYINGILSHIEEVSFANDKVFYKAHLVPRIWQLSLVQTNEIYLDDSTQDTVETVLAEMGFIDKTDFRFNLSGSYKNWPFRLQYKENHWDFVTRILQRDGIFFYFEQTAEREIVVITDDVAHCKKFTSDLKYFTPSAVNTESLDTINQFVCRTEQTPTTIVLRDFNDETPDVDIRFEAQVFPERTIPITGHAINVYGANIADSDECEYLANKYAQSYRCRYQSYTGSGGVVSMQAGARFQLTGHPRNSIKEKTFVIESISHEGTNPALLEGGAEQLDAGAAYTNSFIAYSTEHGYAPLPQRQKPEIKGNLQAMIDAESEGKYAELDDQGRYKVKFPFDRRDRDGGKASYWLRMMQPYGGEGEGMHFPLKKNTRILVAFLGGDPDRPYIAGTLGDATNQSSIVNAENQTNKVIQSSAGNRIEIEDKEGSNRIKLESPTASTYMHLGAPNHNGQGFVMETNGIQAVTVRGGRNVLYKTGTDATSISVTGTPKDGEAITASDNSDAFPFPNINIPDQCPTEENLELNGRNIIERYDGDYYTNHMGNKYEFLEYQSSGTSAKSNYNYVYGVKWEVIHGLHSDSTEPSSLIAEMQDFNLEGCKNFNNPNSTETWEIHLAKGMVKTVKFDTFNLQYGNIYDFGGYWNYNLGNSYTENHLEQTVNVNDDYDRDLLNTGGPNWESLSLPDHFVPTMFDASPFGVKDDKPIFFVSGSEGDIEDYNNKYWVEKTIGGNSYSYSKNNREIEVSDCCNAIDISYGGTSWEVKYNGSGTRVGVEKSGGGVSESWSRTHDDDSEHGLFEEYTITDKRKGMKTIHREYANGTPVLFEIEHKPKPGTLFKTTNKILPTFSTTADVNSGHTGVDVVIGAIDNSVKVDGRGANISLELDLKVFKADAILAGYAMWVKTEAKNSFDFETEGNFRGLKTKAEKRTAEIQAAKKQLELNMRPTIKMVKGKLKVESEKANMKRAHLDLQNALLKLIG